MVENTASNILVLGTSGLIGPSPTICAHGVLRRSASPDAGGVADPG
jgi:hypothetical protein